MIVCQIPGINCFIWKPESRGPGPDPNCGTAISNFSTKTGFTLTIKIRFVLISSYKDHKNLKENIILYLLATTRRTKKPFTILAL